MLNCIIGTTNCVSTRQTYPLGSWYTLLGNHTATRIPQQVTYGGGVGVGGVSTVPATPAIDWTMVQFPFWISSQAHWGVGSNGRWEVDDYPGGTGCSTHHRVWIDTPCP